MVCRRRWRKERTEETGFFRVEEDSPSAKFRLDWRKSSNHKLNLTLPIIAGINGAEVAELVPLSPFNGVICGTEYVGTDLTEAGG
jgi:hypothetical protein